MGKHSSDRNLLAVLSNLEDGPLTEHDLWENDPDCNQRAITAARGDRYITGTLGGKVKLTPHGRSKLAELRRG